jgi:hypothetical protein
MPVTPGRAQRAVAPLTASSGFITVSGTKFKKPDGTDFYFAGTNCYTLVHHAGNYTVGSCAFFHLRDLPTD